MESAICPLGPRSPFPHPLFLPLHPSKFPKPPPPLISLSSSSTSPIACTASSTPAASTAAVKNKRDRYRKAYAGEAKGIVQEMRFVAMKLRNTNNNSDDESAADEEEKGDKKGDTWWPSEEGFIKYLVDSKLVFETLEKIIHDSSDVA